MASLYDSPLYAVDEESATLIIQLQLEDVDYIFSNAKGKSPEGSLSDTNLALRLYKQDLETGASVISDRRMTQSIARAVQTDGSVLRESLAEEGCAAKDREMAQRLDNGSDVSSVTSTDNQLEETMDDEFIAKLQALYVSKIESGQQLSCDSLASGNVSVAESSSWAERRSANQQPIDRRCVACGEDKKFFDVARAPCRHEYCRECLKDLFQTSITDESLFPPRCCRLSIPIGSVRLFLNSELVHAYERKKIEFDTPNRTYCCLPTCSAFIRTENIQEEVAICLDCGTETCTTCKMGAHQGDCPNDVALQQVLQAASENGWQRCYSCWRIVELNYGCNHITCRCGAQFCYVCGERWKECSCEQWDERRLLARANQIVDRDPGPLDPVPALLNEPQAGDIPPPEEELQPVFNIAPAPRDIIVARTIQNLLTNHDCAHMRWRFVRGPHFCEECHHYLREYIFECRQCQLQACNRCKRNRL